MERFPIENNRKKLNEYKYKLKGIKIAKTNYDTLDKNLIHKLGITPKRCSCYMCGNPRKHFNMKTLQEKKSEYIEE